MIFPEALETYFEMYMFKINNIDDEPRKRSREYYQTIFMDAYDYKYCKLQSEVMIDYIYKEDIVKKIENMIDEREAYQNISFFEICMDMIICAHAFMTKPYMVEFINKEIVLSCDLDDSLDDIKPLYLKYVIR